MKLLAVMFPEKVISLEFHEIQPSREASSPMRHRIAIIVPLESNSWPIIILAGQIQDIRKRLDRKLDPSLD